MEASSETGKAATVTDITWDRGLLGHFCAWENVHVFISFHM